MKKTTPEAAHGWFLKRMHDTTMPGARQMYATAKECIEYRIPKKPEPKNYQFGGMILPACPVCGNFLTDEEYCPHCGQSIEWGGYEE